MPQPPAPLWEPSAETIGSANVTAFQDFVARRTGASRTAYRDLWAWSTEDLEGFWGAVWDFHGLDEVFGPHGRVLAEERMPGSRWFPEVSVNYAEYVVSRGPEDAVALVGAGERGDVVELTRGELRRQVAALAHWLRGRGVGRGDRVIGYLPNVPEAVVVMLATAAVGAVWASVGQDYAPHAVGERMGPLGGTVLVTADGYRYAGHEVDRGGAVREVVALLPTVTDVLVVGRRGGERLDVDGAETHGWAEVVAGEAEPVWERVGFDDPLWVLFSSGTTGRPKGMVQSHGGILLEQLKLLGLHLDVAPEDRLFWFTSPSWVMWNIQASALATGASILCYDGAPTHPDPRRLWELVAEHRVTVFGSSPGYLEASRGTGITPAQELDLSASSSTAARTPR